MRVISIEGEFVGFVRQIVNQSLIIQRPAADDIEVPMAACKMSAETVKLNLSAAEITRMGAPQPLDWRWPNKTK